MNFHHFADASEIAYGTVFVLAKGRSRWSNRMLLRRTAPSPFVTVHRLVLQAAVVAATMDGLQNNSAIHAGRDTVIQDVCGKQGDGDKGFPKARTVEIRPGKRQSC